MGENILLRVCWPPSVPFVWSVRTSRGHLVDSKFDTITSRCSRKKPAILPPRTSLRTRITRKWVSELLYKVLFLSLYITEPFNFRILQCHCDSLSCQNGLYAHEYMKIIYLYCRERHEDMLIIAVGSAMAKLQNTRPQLHDILKCSAPAVPQSTNICRRYTWIYLVL